MNEEGKGEGKKKSKTKAADSFSISQACHLADNVFPFFSISSAGVLL